MPIFVSSLGSSVGASLNHLVNQMTDTVVLGIAAELDMLCNEYERLMKGYLIKVGNEV